MSGQKYSLNGWANLCRDGFSITFVRDPLNMMTRVTDLKQITIYLDRFNLDEENEEAENAMPLMDMTNIDTQYKNHYCKTYNSSKGFTLRKILGLINDTYYCYVDEYCDGNDDHVANLALTDFTIVNNKVYAHTDS